MSAINRFPGAAALTDPITARAAPSMIADARNPIVAPQYALIYCRFGNLTLFVPNRPPNGQVDLARRPELADERVGWSRLVIPLASVCLQCNQPLISACVLPTAGLSHLHRVRSTVTGPHESGQSVRIALRARPHETHPTYIFLSDHLSCARTPFAKVRSARRVTTSSITPPK